MKLSDEQGVRKALTYVLPQVNAAPTVAGYSPTQWLLGKQIRLPGELSQDSLNPAHLGGHPNFEELLKHRNAAKRALLDAETDSKLRRALLRKYQGSNIPLKNGQKCYFWRDARQGELVKIRWHGPARVVMVEHDQENVPKVYWLAYKTQLIRCAPHHVRSDFNSMEHAIEDIQLAKKEVMDLKSRGVTRFLDLNVLNRNNVDDILEEDEEMAGEGEELEFQEDDEERPLRRRRLSLEQEPEYSPSIAPTSPGDRPDEMVDQPHDPPLLPVEAQEDGISVLTSRRSLVPHHDVEILPQLNPVGSHPLHLLCLQHPLVLQHMPCKTWAWIRSLQTSMRLLARRAFMNVDAVWTAKKPLVLDPQ